MQSPFLTGAAFLETVVAINILDMKESGALQWWSPINVF